MYHKIGFMSNRKAGLIASNCGRKW